MLLSFRHNCLFVLARVVAKRPVQGVVEQELLYMEKGPLHVNIVMDLAKSAQIRMILLLHDPRLVMNLSRRKNIARYARVQENFMLQTLL